MKEIKLHYTEELLRQAVRASYFNTLKGLRAWIGPILLLSWGYYLLLPLFVGKHYWILVALATAVIWEVLFIFRCYFAVQRSKRKAFHEGCYKGVTLSYSEEQFTIGSESWTVTRQWKTIAKVLRRPTFWLFTFPQSDMTLLPLDCLDAEDREFISRKTQAAKQA